MEEVKREPKFILTKEMLKQADTYIPLAEKYMLATEIAEKCLEGRKTASQNKAADTLLSLPYLRTENTALKRICLMCTLVSGYLNLDIEGEFDQNAYDYYAGSHIFNQFERLKADVEVRDIAFEILADFKDFEKMVTTEIANIKSVNNDAVARVLATMQMGSSPENIQKMLDEIKAIGGDIKQKKATTKRRTKAEKAEVEN